MKKVVLGIIILLLLVVGGAYVYVVSIDWNQHKDKIAEQFYNLTGKRISFDGQVSFKVFPSPYLNAVNAKVYNDDKNEKPLLEISNLVAELALGPLIKGEFDVKRMTLDGVVINIDWGGAGLNWQGDLSPDQRQMMEETKMVLNSMSLKNAEVNFENGDSSIAWKLTNLNGEVSAQSIFGPFRIEGNYMKGNSPEGFALTIGKLTETMPTSLNAVVTHPQSNSYVRFDGNFQLDNKVLNGNVIVESKQLSDFVNANNSEIRLSSEYNQPIALGFDIAINSQNLALSNVVVKYGETQGSGVIEMPLEDEEKPEITASFDFADLDLSPIVNAVKYFMDKYKEEPYAPNFTANLDLDVNAVRAIYNGQGFKNLQASLILDEDVFLIDNLSVVLPGDTSFKLKGNVYPYDDELHYEAETTITATDLMKTLKWLNIEPKANAASVYKKMLTTAKIAGNFDKIQISPYKISMDKSTFSGEAGIVLGDRNDIMLVLNADTINFDNYISSIPDEQKGKLWAERMAYRFSKLGILNDFDMVLNAKADLVIYESMPFEKVDFKGNVLNGVMDIEYCKVDQVANTSLGLSGKVSGFGSIPKMDGLQYEIKSGDMSSLINKLELKVPNLDYKKINNLNMTGMINGDSNNFGINTDITIGALNAKYEGVVDRQPSMTNYKGNIEVKHPDFIKLLNHLKVDYTPASTALGLFSLKATIDGNKQVMDIKGLDANIGYNNFIGNVNYDNSGERPSLIGDLRINKFEIDKFLPRKNGGSLLSVGGQDKPAEFLSKPFWSKDKIDYSPYIKADIKGDFNVAELSYKGSNFKESKFGLELIKGVANVKDFTALYNNTPLTGAASLYMTDTPSVSVNVKIDDANVNDFMLGGRAYNLKGGKFSTRFDFSSNASSEEAFVANLKGKGELSATATELGGINLQPIYDDLVNRDKSEGLAEFVKTHISSGKTLFDKVSGRVLFENGKFSLADTEMQASNVGIKVYGEGDLDAWDMNVVFNIKYIEPKHLPEFSFSLRNGMDNPSVDVNVSSLFKLYQNREEQRIAAKEAEIAAEKTHWADLVNEQKKTADGLVLSSRNKLEKDIDEKIDAAVNQDISNGYNALKQELSNILANLIEVMDSVNPEEGNSEQVAKLSDANKKALGDVEVLEQKFNEIYLEDVKKKNEIEHNKVVEKHNVLKQVVFTYNSQLDKYSERLSRILTDYVLGDDAEFQKHKKTIEDKILAMEDLNNEASEIKNSRETDLTVAEYEKYNQELMDIYDQLSKGVEDLQNKIKLLEEYIVPKIKVAEDSYKRQIEEEEDRRRIVENTGSISIKKTGKTVKVVRDIDEIKNAEQEVSKEAVRVIDFSKEKYSVNKAVETSSENVIKKGRNIRMN